MKTNKNKSNGRGPQLLGMTGSGPWPIKNQGTQREVSSRRVSKTSSVFTAAPHHLNYHLSSASCDISGSIRFSQDHKPIVNYAFKGSMLQAPFEDPMPDDLRWS